jgi:putative DNA primase/helicase
MTTFIQIIDRFRADMAEHGMIIKDPIKADGKLHRVHIEGHKPGTKNGAYTLHLDGKPSGYFEDFTTGLRRTWTDSGKAKDVSPAVRAQIMAERERRLKEQHKAHRAAAERARFIWARAKA